MNFARLLAMASFLSILSTVSPVKAEVLPNDLSSFPQRWRISCGSTESFELSFSAPLGNVIQCISGADRDPEVRRLIQVNPLSIAIGKDVYPVELDVGATINLRSCLGVDHISFNFQHGTLQLLELGSYTAHLLYNQSECEGVPAE